MSQGQTSTNYSDREREQQGVKSGGESIPIKQTGRDQQQITRSDDRSDRGERGLTTRRDRDTDLVNPILDPFGLMSNALTSWPFGGSQALFDPFRGSTGVVSDFMNVGASDFNEYDKNFLLTVDLPGVPKENVRLDLKGRRLTVSCDKKEEKQDEWSSSRQYGKFSRSMLLPTTADSEGLEAKIEHGQLKVMIPKVAPEKQSRRDIQIK
jgi:HSP20 family protein